MIQYAPKLTYGPQVADWQERLNPERMRRQRVARAQRIMKQHGVAALLEANQHNTGTDRSPGQRLERDGAHPAQERLEVGGLEQRAAT